MIQKEPNEKSLILDAIFKLNQIKRKCDLTGYHEALNMAIEALQFQQSVVRCKDCKYSNGTSCKVNHDEYGFWLNVLEIRYCSRGERRDEE